MEKETYNRLLNKRMNEIQEISKKIDSNNLVYYFKSNWSSKIDFIKFKGPYGLFRDTVINVVPNADISKTQNHIFFQLYQKYQFLHPNILSGYIWVCYGTIQYKKLDFLGKMAGKDGKVTFCYISISYLKIEIR